MNQSEVSGMKKKGKKEVTRGDKEKQEEKMKRNERE